MDPVGSFATIVGLLADFAAHRSGRTGAAEFAEFAEWLRFHGHTEVLAAIEANHATTISVKAALAEGYESLALRLKAIERELAALSTRHGPLGHLAKALYPEIPADILNHICPGVPRERVSDVLGSAHKVVSNVWWYRCREAMVQVEFYKDSGAQSVALALTLESPASGFVVPGFGKALGSMRLADILSDDAPLRFRSSLRTEELLVETRVGPTGAWKNFTFGVLRPLAPGSLMDVEFDWDYETQALRSKPSEVLINWVGISESIEEVWFDWSVAVP